jgi:hypothetical protein
MLPLKLVMMALWPQVCHRAAGIDQSREFWMDLHELEA